MWGRVTICSPSRPAVAISGAPSPMPSPPTPSIALMISRCAFTEYTGRSSFSRFLHVTHWYQKLHLFNGHFSRTTWKTWHQKGKPFWILMKQRKMGWQWHQLDHMQVICILLQTCNHASTSPLSFYRPDDLPAAQPTASKHWTHTGQPSMKFKIITITSYPGSAVLMPNPILCITHFTAWRPQLAVWCSRSIVCRMNKVTLCWAWLVLEWVTYTA